MCHPAITFFAGSLFQIEQKVNHEDITHIWPEVNLEVKTFLGLKRVSYYPEVSLLTRSQFRGKNLIILDPRSRCWTRAILDIESTQISDVSIGLAMVSIHISHLIGQMTGTSHESKTPWARCVQGIDQREANQLNIIGGAEAQ